VRFKNLIRNSFFAVLGQILLILFGFFSQRVLNLKLGEALVGLNGVVSNVISILSVSELGIATAVVYNLYRALAANDEEEIAGLMNLYRKAYHIFAAVISVLGLLAMPLLPYFLKDNPFSMGYVRCIYLLWLLRTVLSYLLSYRRSILIADQREYLVSIAALLANVVNYSVVIGVVSLTENYVLALSINIVVESVSNLWISWYVMRTYPFLGRLRKQPLARELRQKVFDNIKNIFVVRFANKLLVATDNVIISGFISVSFAGLFNNYSLIINSLNNIAVALSNAIQPSVGTLLAQEQQENSERMLRATTCLFFLFGSFAGCGVYAAANAFVGDIWLGADYLLKKTVVTACVLNFFVYVLSMPVGMVMGVTGLFDRERRIAVVSAAGNMILSLGLVKPLGIYGVLLGTAFAYLSQLIYRVYVFYRIYLERTAISYVKDLIQYILLFALELLWANFIRSRYPGGGLLAFAGLCVLAAAVPLAVNLLLFGRRLRWNRHL
jgi:O-antigen/teichoic acid export membrane protein